GYRPCRARMSAKFKPAARTRIRTSSSRGVGSGFSWTLSTSMSPFAVVTICRIDRYYQFCSGLSELICAVLICADTMRTLLLTLLLLLAVSCTSQPSRKQLTLAVISGAEGEALTAAAHDYEAQTGVHINIAQFPYANLFEKELIDLKSRTGAYDLIMLDDPWFPKFANENVLTE